MKRSTDRIITTHTGSLPRPGDLVELLNAKEVGESYDRAAFARRVRASMTDMVRRQVESGIDVVGDGEHSKVNFRAYARDRLAGLEAIDSPATPEGPTRDSIAFAGAYEDARVMLAARSSAIVPQRKALPQDRDLHRPDPLCRRGRARRLTSTTSRPRCRA